MAKPLEILFPFKPMIITQDWGVPNPLYAQYGFKLHNGLDIKRNFFDIKYPVYCPVEGFHVQQVVYTAGGGNEVYLISDNPVKMFDLECYAWMVFMHNAEVLVKAGESLKMGQILAVGNNTGNSSGPHSHFGVYRVDIKCNKLDTNDANGSFDPKLFFPTGWQTNPKYAIDQADLPTLISNNLKWYQWRLRNPTTPL
jgi:murein DD-endopeptidase MepM/ murein hydrolase activator NlpD